MRSNRHLIAPLMLFASSLAVSSCAGQVALRPLFPPSADLAIEQNCPAADPNGIAAEAAGHHCKPIPTDEIVTSAQAAANYDIARGSWGERGWMAVARLCRWAKEQGAPVDCPAP